MRRGMRPSVRMIVCAVLTIVATAAPLWAQESMQAADTVKAIRELTGEVRSLRVAIERTAESQLQGQILGLYLSLQQNRVTHATSRLDAVRRELDTITTNARELTQNAAALDTALSQEADPAKRQQLEQQIRDQKVELERMAAQEQQLRAREGEADQATQTEEARWTELISRLEQLLKK
jgi:hypothetical protein